MSFILNKGKNMNISRSLNNVSFGKVYAIGGTDEQISKLKSFFDNSTGDFLYLQSKKSEPSKIKRFLGLDTNQNSKSIALIISGKKDIENIRSKQKGWRFLREIAQHVEKYVDLTSVKN